MVVTLGNGLEFDGGTSPVSGDLTLSVPGGGAADFILLAGGEDGHTSVSFFVDVTDNFNFPPTFALNTTGWTLRDTFNLLELGGTATITVQTQNASNAVFFDEGIETADWLNIAGPNCPPLLTCEQIGDLTEVSIASALRSEQAVVAQLVDLLSQDEIIADLYGNPVRDLSSLFTDLAAALAAIDVANGDLDSAEINQCLEAPELSFTRTDLSNASVLDSYVSLTLGDPFSEVTLQTLINLMDRAIEDKEDAMERLISVDFF